MTFPAITSLATVPAPITTPSRSNAVIGGAGCLFPQPFHCCRNEGHTPFILFGELQRSRSAAENKKNRAQSEKCFSTANPKNPSRKNLSSENLLKTAKECDIISQGRRLSGCIGVLSSLLCKAIVLPYGSLPFLYYTTKADICQPLLKIMIRHFNKREPRGRYPTHFVAFPEMGKVSRQRRMRVRHF